MSPHPYAIVYQLPVFESAALQRCPAVGTLKAARNAASAEQVGEESERAFWDEDTQQAQQSQQVDDADGPTEDDKPSATPPPAAPVSDLESMVELANSQQDYEYRGSVRYMEANFHRDALRGDVVDPVYGRQKPQSRVLYDSALDLVLEKHT